MPADPVDHVDPVDGAVTVWQQPDGFWRWGWAPLEDGRTKSPPPEELDMLSYRSFDSFEEARTSAQESFPGAALPDPPEESAEPPKRARHLVRRLFLGVLVLMVAARIARSRQSSTSAASGSPFRA